MPQSLTVQLWDLTSVIIKVLRISVLQGYSTTSDTVQQKGWRLRAYSINYDRYICIYYLRTYLHTFTLFTYIHIYIRQSLPFICHHSLVSERKIEITVLQIKIWFILVLSISSSHAELKNFKRENVLFLLCTCFILKEKSRVVYDRMYSVWCPTLSSANCWLTAGHWNCYWFRFLVIWNKFLQINCMWPSKLGTVPSFDSCSCKTSTFQRVVTVDNLRFERGNTRCSKVNHCSGMFLPMKLKRNSRYYCWNPPPAPIFIFLVYILNVFNLEMVIQKTFFGFWKLAEVSWSETFGFWYLTVYC